MNEFEIAVVNEPLKFYCMCIRLKKGENSILEWCQSGSIMVQKVARRS